MPVKPDRLKDENYAVTTQFPTGAGQARHVKRQYIIENCFIMKLETEIRKLETQLFKIRPYLPYLPY